ncbi:RHS repeat domain-containing protein [Catellatospora bangladeshensis]|uniref:RHS repeat domain-containing protein n=1 Tax=Catellatospora bangladeshensis TaxID=310355 RepID=UPI00361B6CA3
MDFSTTTKGVKVAKEAGGNLRVADAKGVEVFRGSAPQMWNDAAQRDVPVKVREGEDLSDGSAARVAGRLPVRKTMTTSVSSHLISLVPDQGMLSSPTGNLPLYIDPGLSLSRGNWGYVDSAFPTTSYWNTSAEASVGVTNNGIRRSYFNVPINGKLANKYVTSATFNTNNTFSYSCVAKAVELWATGSISPSMKWSTGQPSWTSLQQSKTFAHGNGSSCPSAPETFNIVNQVRAAASNNLSSMTFGLRATSETDPAAFKRFSNNPTITVNYTTYAMTANRSTAPSTICATGTGRPYINTATPQLATTVSDADNSPVRALFEWWAVGGTAAIGGATTGYAPSMTRFTTTVPAGAFSDGGSYQWRVRGADATIAGNWSPWCELTVDVTAPHAGPTVSSATYPAGEWHGSAGTAADFVIGAAGVADVSAYSYGFDTNPPTVVVSASSLGADVSINLTPMADGPHKLFVQSQDRAGNLSPITEYGFNVGDGAIVSPVSGDTSAGWVALQGAAQPTATGMTYQWRRGDADGWATVPAADVTVASGGGPVTWPVPSSGVGSFPKLTWNMAKTVNDAEAGPDALDGPLQIQAVFVGGSGGTSSVVKLTLDRNRASAASAQVGPAHVNLLTGNATLSANDVSVAALAVGRMFNTRQAGGTDPMFGPGWTSSVLAAGAQAPYTGLTVTGSLVQASLPDGAIVGFTKKTVTGMGADYDSEPGKEGLTLKYVTNGDKYTITDSDGTVTTFTLPTGAAVGQYVPTAVNVAGSNTTTTLSWEKATVDGVEVMRPTRMLAPIPSGGLTDCGDLTADAAKGCRALTFSYAATSTATGTDEAVWGDWTGRVKEIAFSAWSPTHSEMQTQVLARYAYDNNGRLRASWDPRLDHDGQHLSERYDYDGDGLLTQMRPNAQEPWQFTYSTIPTDPAKGRLGQVSRSALSAGIAKTTVVYHVPTAGTGAPHDLSVTQTARWGQTEAPVEAAAVFPPTQVPDGDQAAGAMPSSFERATVTYLDANGRAVNTAAPGGGISAVWYDQYGNAVRGLDAANRQQALDASGSDSIADEAAMAAAISTISVFSIDGQRLLETFGPEHDVTLASGAAVRGRAHSVTSFDQGLRPEASTCPPLRSNPCASATPWVCRWTRMPGPPTRPTTGRFGCPLPSRWIPAV